MLYQRLVLADVLLDCMRPTFLERCLTTCGCSGGVVKKVKVKGEIIAECSGGVIKKVKVKTSY